MARQPLLPGTHGKVTFTTLEDGRIRGRSKYKPLDSGSLRSIEAIGKSEGAVKRLLALNIEAKNAAQKQSALAAKTRASAETTVAGLLPSLWGRMRTSNKASAKSLEKYQSAARTTILPALGDQDVRRVTAGDLDVFLSEVWRTKPGLYKAIRTILRQLFDQAVLHGYVTFNPVLPVPTPKWPKKVPVSLTIEQINEVRAAFDIARAHPHAGRRPNYDTLEMLLEIQIGTGARFSESAARTWADVDLISDPPTMLISSTVEHLKGVGYYIKPIPKSESSSRRVYLPQYLVELLRLWKATSDSEMLFPNSRGNVPSTHNLWRQWRDVKRLSGLADIHPHLLRKTVATEVSRAMGDEASQKQMGHSSPDVTRGHYIAPAEMGPDARAVLERFAPPSAGSTGSTREDSGSAASSRKQLGD
jgi:integrase